MSADNDPAANAGSARRKRRWVAFGLAALGGVLAFLGWAGFGLWPLELVALVPLWTGSEFVREDPLWAQLAVGWIYGVVAISGGYHWMLAVVQEFSGFGGLFSTIFFVACCIYLGLQYGIQTGLYSAIRSRGWCPSAAAIPTFIVTEWLFPRWFPAHLSVALFGQELLIQAADLGGPLLVGVLLATINLGVFELIRWALRMRSAPVMVVTFALLTTGFFLGYGAYRASEIESEIRAAPTLAVGLVQANVGIDEGQRDPLGGHRMHVIQSRVLEEEGPLDLIVWPESSYRYPTFGRMLPIIATEIASGWVKTPILFGGLSGVKSGTLYSELYNTAFLVDEDGLIGQVYDKRELLPLGEFIPFGDWFPRLYELAPNTTRFDSGAHVVPFSLGPWRIATPICYEDLLPGLVRRMVNKGNPHLLVNLTNDAWFGKSQGPTIHFRMAQFRAIEHRRYLVRSTNTGVSGVVDPVGRAVARTDVGRAATVRARVGMMQGRTIYAAVGDWPGWLALLITVLLLACQRGHYQSS